MRQLAGAQRFVAMTPLQLFTLGALRLQRAGEDLLPGRRKELVLLAYLVHHAPRAVPRAELAALLWGEKDEARARQSLRQALLKLRRTLGEVAIEITPESARGEESAVILDAALFESDLAAGRLEAAVGRWRGDFLAGLEEVGSEEFRVWLEAERERLRRGAAAALEQLVTGAQEQGDWSASVTWAERWVEIEPLGEQAHIRLIEALRLAGRPEEAAGLHAAFTARCRSEFGSDPSPEFLLLDRPSLPTAPPAAASAAAPRSSALFSPDLVGRGPVFGQLVEQWQAVRQGGTAVIVVEGEEGIGKTRLCEEFLRWVEETSGEAFVLRARAYEAEQQLAWTAARDLLAGLDAAPGLCGAPDEALAGTARLVPSIRDRFPSLPDAPEGEAEIGDAVLRVLGDVAAEVPVVLFLDDLPAADEPTRQLLLSLVRRAPARLLLLLSARTAAPGYYEILEPLREVPGLLRFPLAPLSLTEVETLLGSMLILEPDVRRRLALRLHREGEGNPFYTIALTAALADAGHLAPDATGVWRISLAREESLPLPPDVRDAVRARLEHLGPGARQVLGAAAVLGRTIDPPLLERVARQPPTEFCQAVEELIARRLLRVAPPPARGYEFTHDLIRRVTCELLGPARRRMLEGAAQAAGFPLPSGSEAAHPGQQHRRRRAGMLRPRISRGVRRFVLPVVALALVAVLAAVAWWQRSLPPASPTVVAVLPFQVHGAEHYGYLREGLVDLLSVKLNGAGELRGVDPRALTGFVNQDRHTDFDPQYGRTVAQHFGAGLYVIGSVVETGGRLRVSAALYDLESGMRGMVEASADDEASIFELVDDLARQLLERSFSGPRADLKRLAARTTSSLPALKAFLEGERHFRSGNYAAATGAFERAVAIDSVFALSYYRLNLAQEWNTAPAAAAERSIAGAERHAHRLSGHSQTLIRALRAWRRGDAAKAEAMYRSALAAHPDDVEAWSHLGEVLFHSNPLRGRSISEAREPWERVLALEPQNPFAHVHLARIAAAERDGAQLDTLLRAMLAQRDSADRLLIEVSALRALALGERSEQERLLAWLREIGGAGLTIPVWHVATYSRELAGAERFARLQTEPHNSQGIRQLGHLTRAHLHLASGRWRAAQAELARIEPMDPSLALTFRAWLSSLPFVPVSRTELLRLRDEVRAWQPILPRAHGSLVAEVHADAYPQIRTYLLGMLSMRLDESTAALHYAGELESAGGSPSSRAVGQDLALSVRARAAASEGRLEDAQRFLERGLTVPPRGMLAHSPFYGWVYERYLRGELLRQRGRDREALAWYASLGEVTPFEAAFLAPSHLRRAEIYERLGERENAAEHYRRFLELWKDADPELQPWVAKGAQRLESL